MPFTQLLTQPIMRERVVDTSTNFILSDAQNMVTVNVGTAVTLTIPLHSVEPIPIGSQILVHRLGSGTVTLATASGATLNAVSPTLRAQFSFAALVKRAENVWSAGGDLG